MNIEKVQESGEKKRMDRFRNVEKEDAVWIVEKGREDK